MTTAERRDTTAAVASGEFGTRPDAAAHARRMARGFLDHNAPQAPAEAADVVELVVAELVTNVVRHAMSRHCLMELADLGDGVEIAVSDGDPSPPRAREPDYSGGGGFGWPLVCRLASFVKVSTRATGKTVHAVVPYAVS
ncbi:ATP-binding protein [Streptomyces sp. NPDC002004]